MNIRRIELKATLLMLVGVSVAGSCARSQEPEQPIVEKIIESLDDLQVIRINPDRSVVLGCSDAIDPRFRTVNAYYTEGYYLLLTGGTSPVDKLCLLRAQVSEVADFTVTLKIGASAGSRLKVKDKATLIRPPSATTAWFRALSDEIPFTSDPANPNAVAASREIAARNRAIAHLYEISRALQGFHSAHNQYPPAVIAGPDGKPWHSWRVLILPYLGEIFFNQENITLYNAYDFQQPWDSPKNKAVLDKMPDAYRDPIHGDTKEPYTHFAALVGPKSVFRPGAVRMLKETPKTSKIVANFGAPLNQDPLLPLGEGGTTLGEIKDGPPRTVIISSVEASRKIPWTRPEDIDVGPNFKGFGSPGGIAAPYTFSAKGGGKAAPFLFAFGAPQFIGTTIDRKILEALLTSQGGEPIPFNSYPVEPERGLLSMPVLRIRGEGIKASASLE